MPANASVLYSSLLCLGLIPIFSLFGCGRANKPPLTHFASVYDVPLTPRADDATAARTLAPYRGKTLLIVNVASHCGFTPQYEGLEALYRKYKDRGLVVLGFPANDFLNQEPGTEAEIMTFCKTKYDVTFPIYGKLHVKGKEQAPLYQYLTGPESPYPGAVRWNFEKFLIGPDGKIQARFRTPTKPESKAVIEAIEKSLLKR